jgi:hypothetical protein
MPTAGHVTDVSEITRDFEHWVVADLANMTDSD